MCRWFPEQKTNGTVSYIFVSSIANVFYVSLRIWLCIYGTTLRFSLYDVQIAWIERRLALAPFVVSVQRNRFCTLGGFSWQNSPVKFLFARKVQDGRAKRPHSGTLQREQAPAPPYKHKHKPHSVILSEAKDLKPKYKMCETRFFAERLRMTNGRANTVRPYEL